MRLPLTLLIICFAIAVQGQAIKSTPANEETQDPSLQDFLTEMKRAIAYKDHSFIISALDEQARWSSDHDGNATNFVREFDVTNPTSTFWDCLDRVISLGGVFLPSDESTGNRRFVMPYTYNLKLENPMDYFNAKVITATGVNVRDRAGLSSNVIGQLTNEVVWVNMAKSTDPPEGKMIPCEPKEWYFVETLDKRLSGYVYWKFTFSPAGYNLFLEKENGKWIIKSFLMGE